MYFRVTKPKGYSKAIRYFAGKRPYYVTQRIKAMEILTMAVISGLIAIGTIVILTYFFG